MATTPPVLRRQIAATLGVNQDSDAEFSDGSSDDNLPGALPDEPRDSVTFPPPSTTEQLMQLRTAFNSILDAIHQDKTSSEAYRDVLNIYGDTEIVMMLPLTPLGVIEELKLQVSILEKLKSKIDVLENQADLDTESDYDSENDLYLDLDSDELAEMTTDEDSDSEDRPRAPVRRRLRF